VNVGLILLGFSLASSAIASAQDTLVAAADHLAANLLGVSKTPGLAFVLVRNDSVLLARGYGKRSHGANDVVDEKTLFGVGGFTKGVTGAALATLVDQGKVRWDDPVRQHLPSFRLSDGWVSEHLTVRDLVLMRIGMLRADTILRPTRSSAQILSRVAELPVSEFRTSYGISSNLAYFLAGEVAAAASGLSWEELVRQRLLSPLGMESTTPRLSAVLASPNLARPHTQRGDSLVGLEPTSLEYMAGAAALYSNALDIGAWLKLHLGRGRFGGRQIISDTSMREMHTPLVVSSVGNFRGLINRYASVVGFGIGWHISDYRGRKVLENVGIFGGYSQYIVLVPDHNLGFAIMANLAPALPLRDAIQDLKFALLDIAIGPTAPALRRSP